MITSQANMLALAASTVIATFPAQCMEPESASIQKPTITVHLSINHKPPFGGCIFYTGKKYHEFLNKTVDIKTSIQHQQKMPVLSPICIEAASGKNWVYHTLEVIGRHELGERYTDRRCIFLSKQFPHSIPVDLLYNRATGEKINLTIYGYPVIAICTDNPESKLSFKDQLDQYIYDFKEKPLYVSSIDSGEEVLEQLIKAQLIADISHEEYAKNLSLNHGPHGFISIDQLILEDKILSHPFKYLRNREIGKKI